MHLQICGIEEHLRSQHNGHVWDIEQSHKVKYVIILVLVND